MPKISVVVTCYKQADELEFALKSVLNQTFSLWECIIVNDDSPDHTEEVAERWLSKDPRFKYIKQKNGGLSSARNTGINYAKGVYIMPLDADDSLPLHALEEVYRLFSTQEDADFIFGNYILFNKETNERQEVNCEEISKNGQIDIEKLINNWILLGTSPCKKTLWQKINGYALKYSNSVQDVDFWIRAVKAGAKGFYINENIYTWHRSEFGMNASYDRKDYFLLMNEHLPFIKLYKPFKKTINEICLGFYSNHLLKEMFFLNIRHFFSISLKNHMRLFWLVVIKLKN